MGGLMKMGLYFAFQYAGAFAAVLLGMAVRQFSDTYPTILAQKNSWSTFFAEFFATGTWVFIIAIATHKKYPPTKMAPINTAVIIGWFYCVASIAGPLSGGALNPAVMLAIDSLNVASNSMRYDHARVFGEIVGVIFFAAV